MDSRLPLTSELLARVAEAVAPGAEAVSAMPARGSFSNLTHLIRLRHADGRTETIVLKRCLAEGGGAAQRVRAESGALGLVRRTCVPVAAPLYVDLTGDVLGRPGLIMSFMQGEQVVDPADARAWARSLAATLAQVHSVWYEAASMLFLFDGNRKGTWFLRDDMACG